MVFDCIECVFRVFSWVVFADFPETSISPENQCLEDDISFWDGLFTGAKCFFFKTSGTRGFSVVSGNSNWGPTIVAPISTNVVTGCFSTYLEIDSTCS